MTSVPPARSSAEAEDDRPSQRSRAARRALGLALLAGAVGAALALLSGGQVWSHSTASFAQGELPVEAKGSDVTGLPSALALVGLAALVAVFAVRRKSRLLVACFLEACGAVTLVTPLLVADDGGPLADKAAKASGLASSGIDAVHVTAWPYVCSAGGLLLLFAGALALRYGPSWPSMSGSARYERTPGPGARAAGAGGSSSRGQVDPDRPEDMWKALDRGEDPTHGTR